MIWIRRLVRVVILRVPGARWFKERVIDPFRRSEFQLPLTRPSARGPAPEKTPEELWRAYEESGLHDVEDTFVLYRIIGNDLTPRHRKGQSRSNLEFILEHEPPFPGCEKRFVVNRIVDPDEERRIVELLENAGVPYLHIPFRWDEYARVGWDVEGVPAEYQPYGKRFAQLEPAMQGRILMRLYRYKNNYVMNNNGARNAALRDGRGRAKWVLPWDGNCFLTAEGWTEIRHAVTAAPEVPYWLVPMARITDNRELLAAGFRPAANEEPQMLFRRDASLEFDPECFYGRRPKVELFWRLGVSGNWDSWPVEPWDLPCPPYAGDAGAFGFAGWVARLYSGQAHLEQSAGRALVDRGLARVEAVVEMLDRLDERARHFPEPDETVLVKETRKPETDDALRQQLQAAADEAMSRGPYSVVDKSTLPPSNDPHDYWHPAPYYWPNPLRIPGLPYIRRDGRRVPGTLMYEPLSEKYDRTRLQRLFDDTWVLALAFREFGERRYIEHAARLVRAWFLDERTRMNPNLEYAQVRYGHNGNRGNSSGIIEMKDLYYFLDGVRLVSAADGLSTAEMDSLRGWFEDYLHWLRTSPQGRQERASGNNHGTYYDLQVASIALFLGKYDLAGTTLRDSYARILQQFEPDGRQPEELARTTTAHYCCFNLQGWTSLADLAARCGEDLWSFRGAQGQGIESAMRWLLRHVGRDWPYPQIDTFDGERFYPIYYACIANYEDAPEVDRKSVPPAASIKPLFHPHDGITPFWQLG